MAEIFNILTRQEFKYKTFFFGPSDLLLTFLFTSLNTHTVSVWNLYKYEFQTINKCLISEQFLFQTIFKIQIKSMVFIHMFCQNVSEIWAFRRFKWCVWKLNAQVLISCFWISDIYFIYSQSCIIFTNLASFDNRLPVSTSQKQTKFYVLKNNNFKIGNNILTNRLSTLNNKIELKDLNKSLSAFKVIYKSKLLTI